MNYIKIAIFVFIGIICFFCFRLIYGILTNVTNAKDALSTTLDATMKERNTYNRAKLKLSQLGIMYRFDDDNLAPSKYVLLRVMIGLITGALITALMGKFSFVLFIACAIIGFFLCDGYFIAKNKSDNEEMLNDLFNIYLTLKIQLSSNIHITNSLQSCREMVRNKRLMKALDELIANLSTHTITYLEAIEIFKNRFKSDNITNLCAFLKSYAQYGVTERYLADIMSEINEISTATTMKEEHNIETKSGIVNFIFFASIVGVIAYGAFSMIGEINLF